MVRADDKQTAHKGVKDEPMERFLFLIINNFN